MCDDHHPLPIIHLHPAARTPTQAHASDAGHDLATPEPFVLWPGFPRVVPTGLAIALPHGVHGIIKGRSGLAARGIGVLGGVIDQTYTGQIKVVLINHSWWPKAFRAGDRVAQLVLSDTVAVRPVVCKEGLPSGTDGLVPAGATRGDRGFASSGR